MKLPLVTVILLISSCATIVKPKGNIRRLENGNYSVESDSVEGFERAVFEWCRYKHDSGFQIVNQSANSEFSDGIVRCIGPINRDLAKTYDQKRERVWFEAGAMREKTYFKVSPRVRTERRRSSRERGEVPFAK